MSHPHRRLGELARDQQARAAGPDGHIGQNGSFGTAFQFQRVFIRSISPDLTRIRQRQPDLAFADLSFSAKTPAGNRFRGRDLAAGPGDGGKKENEAKLLHGGVRSLSGSRWRIQCWTARGALVLDLAQPVTLQKPELEPPHGGP